MKKLNRYSFSVLGPPTAMALGILVGIPSANGEVYTVRPLGSLGGTANHAAALNNVGQVVGNSRTSAGLYHAYIYVNGMITDLGTLPGGANSSAQGINLSGQVVGDSELGPDLARHATRWFGRTATDIGLLGGRYSSANAINDAGVIVGTISVGDYYPDAARWDSDVITDLSATFMFSYANGINQSGQVVGMGIAGEPFGYIWNGTVPAELVNYSGSDGITDAKAINASGQVAGSEQVLTAFAPMHAVLWSGNGMPKAGIDLGTLGGTHSGALGINAAAQVVGFADTAAQVQHAVVWSNAQIVDLNTALNTAEAAHITLTVASAINDHGWIVADGVDSRTGGITSAYLLIPATASCHSDPGRGGAEHGKHDDARSHYNDRSESDKGRPETETGMTRDEVQHSEWGAPLRVDRANNGPHTSELWWYHDNRYLLFTDGCLKSIHK